MPRKPQIVERKLGRERADGLYHSDGLIEIDPRIKGKKRIDTLIHEHLHHYLPDMPEDDVTKLATSIANALWANRVRIIDSEK